MNLAAIEAGGTKFVVAIGNEHGEVLKRHSFPTTTPEETMNHVYTFFDKEHFEAMGVGSFGPIDPDPQSPTYGYITTTPKPGWNNFNILKALKDRYDVPIGFDTDVNGACLGETMFGAAKGLNSSLYLTIGTGIGGGAIVENHLVHGLLHPEMGHIRLVRHQDDTYEGKCPYHKDCFEGLAAGTSIEERFQKKAFELPEDHPYWDIESYYIAQACVNYILILSPKKIILGGGVMKQRQLFPKIRKNVIEMLQGYVQKDEIIKSIDTYIVPPALEDNAGICGSLAIALQAKS